ncbi:MAG TPA: large-conductance mechanosensitive channel protein MscL [Caulobacterales bacterium]|nr:large-conductance mechanosensitive channel protein MscL [Caulobacterales bacterium]HWA21097.1 large-conductance mechanosensitive channel protein MscL [Caulobacterales bacterium]
MSVLKEFREFALKGSVVDLAVGVIIGAAFGSIVSSLVDDVIMPPIGMLLAGIDFSALKWVLKEAVPAVGATPAHPEVAINYGKFLNAVIKFTIVAWVLFLIIRGMNRLRDRVEKKPEAAPAETPADIKLLAEIRDLLKAK